MPSFAEFVKEINEREALQAITDLALQGALDAIMWGGKVFPILWGTKDVCLTAWVYGGPGEEASSDLAQVIEWANVFGRCNWGMDTSGWSVVDTDSPEGHKWAVDKGLTDTRCVKSGSAIKEMAFHYYHRNPDGRKVKCGKIPGCDKGDIKGAGGMVLLPGSLHPDGNLYALVDDREPAETPEWFLEQFKKPEEEPAVDISDMKPLSDEQKRIALRSFREGLKKFDETPEGQRHFELVKLARKTGNILAWKLLEREHAEAQICEIGLERARSQRAFKSTLKKNIDIGMRKPWNAEKVDEFLKEKGERKANSVGFGNAALPAGAYKEPLAPAVAASVAEPPPVFERGLPRLAQKTEVMPFPTHLLGPVLQQAAEAIARRVDCVPDIAAHSVLSGAALAVCPHYDVRLVYGQVRPTSLFMMSVGRSGDRKTSADSEAMVAVGMWEKELRLRYKRDKPAYDAAMERWEKAYKKHLEDPGYPATPAPVEPKRPSSPVVRCDEPTAEGLRDSFLRGSKILGLYGDEGAKFLGGHSMKEEHRLNCIGSLSTMWDGSEIRKMRAGNEVDSAGGYRLAAHLMMQPGIAESFLGNALYQEQGILARFLVSWADLESLDGRRPYKEPDPNYDNIIRPYQDRVYQLLSTRLPEDEWGNLAPLTVNFSPGAKALWIEYQNESQMWLRPRGKWKPIRAFGEKALEHAARLGVVLQQFNSCSLELSAEYFEAGWQLVLYYASQLLATQSVGNDPELVKAHLLYQWLEDKHEGEFVDLRTLRTHGPRSLREKKVVEPIISVLREHGLLEPVGAVNNRWKIHRGL